MVKDHKLKRSGFLAEKLRFNATITKIKKEFLKEKEDLENKH
jgi:hypothetical protein